MARRFIITFILVAVVYGGFAAFNFSIVYLAGETRSYADIARTQQDAPETIYGPVFNNGHGAYKYALMGERPHEVVVAGSSRALQYRQGLFSAPMVNCGRILSSVRTALNFFEYMEQQPPKTILLLADFWWFRRPLREVTGGHEFTTSTGTERSLDMFFMPVWYAVQGKIDIGRVMQHCALFNDRPGLIGIRAMGQEYGFAADGSYGEAEGSRQDHEAMVANVKTRIGKKEFSYHKRVQVEALNAFFDGVARLKELGHKVVVVFPPLSPAVFGEISANKGYAYISKTVRYAVENGAFDLHDPTRLGLTPKEFHDSLHTTARGDAAVLRELARYYPELRQVVDLEAIEAFLASDRELP